MSETQATPEPAEPANPPEILTDHPRAPSREQTLKRVQDKYPGHIAWASDRANFSGCRAIRFTPEGVVGLEKHDNEKLLREAQEHEANGGTYLGSPEGWANLYFSTRANLLVVERTLTEESIGMLITTQLDADDLEEFQEVTKRVELDMREWRAKRAEQRASEEAARKDEARLADIGRTVEEHNLIGKLRELEAKVKELSKAEKTQKKGK